jgi:hypothetical protein
MEINRYKVTFQSFLFRYSYIVVASSEESAIYIAMEFNEFAPRHCFSASIIETNYTGAY